LRRHCVAGAKRTFHTEGMEDVGQPFPKLREVAEIKTDPEFADDFADAAVAVVDVDLPARAVRVNISKKTLNRGVQSQRAYGQIVKCIAERLLLPPEEKRPPHWLQLQQEVEVVDVIRQHCKPALPACRKRTQSRRARSFRSTA
jgi:hypothetical protein